MFSRFDPLVDFRCPRCRASLRFRRVEELPASRGAPDFLCACPECEGSILLRQHAAFPDNWRWMVFIGPGILLCAVGIFFPAAAGLLPWALFLLAAGLLALVAYMIRQRWGWQCYVLPPDDSLPKAGA
jgi:hypothetical protein